MKALEQDRKRYMKFRLRCCIDFHAGRRTCVPKGDGIIVADEVWCYRVLIETVMLIVMYLGAMQ